MKRNKELNLGYNKTPNGVATCVGTVGE